MEIRPAIQKLVHALEQPQLWQVCEKYPENDPHSNTSFYLKLHSGDGDVIIDYGYSPGYRCKLFSLWVGKNARINLTPKEVDALLVPYMMIREKIENERMMLLRAEEQKRGQIAATAEAERQHKLAAKLEEILDTIDSAPTS